MVTLAEIETELARRTGPYESHPASGGGSSTVDVAEIASVDDTGEYDDRWLLRRSAPADDRQRRIARISVPGTGTLAITRAYATPPAVGEAIEIMGGLDPTQHLRQAARVGLSRCFFEDRITVISDGTWAAVSGYTWAQIAAMTWADLLTLAALPSTIADRDLTALLPWLTRPTQLRAVMTTWTGSTWGPTSVEWWQWFTQGGHVRLNNDPDPLQGVFYVTALRPADSWVNGADSTTGPLVDADTVEVDLEYAVVSAHKYLWETVPDRLVGYGKSAAEVDRAWRVQCDKHVRPPPDRLQLGAPYGAWSGLALV